SDDHEGRRWDTVALRSGGAAGRLRDAAEPLAGRPAARRQIMEQTLTLYGGEDQLVCSSSVCPGPAIITALSFQTEAGLRNPATPQTLGVDISKGRGLT